MSWLGWTAEEETELQQNVGRWSERRRQLGLDSHQAWIQRGSWLLAACDVSSCEQPPSLPPLWPSPLFILRSTSTVLACFPSLPCSSSKRSALSATPVRGSVFFLKHTNISFFYLSRTHLKVTSYVEQQALNVNCPTRYWNGCHKMWDKARLYNVLTIMFYKYIARKDRQNQNLEQRPASVWARIFIKFLISRSFMQVFFLLGPQPHSIVVVPWFSLYPMLPELPRLKDPQSLAPPTPHPRSLWNLNWSC